MKKIFLICLLFSFLGGEVVRFTFFSSVSVRLLDVVTFLICIAFIIELIRNQSKRLILFTASSKWIGIFFLIGVLSLIVNLVHFPLSEIGEASLYLIRFLMYTGVYYYFSDLSKEEGTFAIRVLTVTGSTLVFFGFIQYFYYNNLRNLYYLGWDDHMYRIFSVFLDPNFTGILFVLFALFLMGRVWLVRKEKKKRLFYGLVVLLICTLIATMMTFSRSSLIALGTGCIVFLSLIGRKRYLIYFFSVMGGMILLATPFFYIENVNLFRTVSTEARIESAKIALLIIKDNFLTGVGFNTYRYAQIHYGFRRGVGAEVSHADSGTDNSYLFVLATTGIFGLITYGGLLRSLLISAWNRYLAKKSLFAVVFISSLAAVMIDSLFVNSLFYPFVIVWLWILTGLVSYR